MLTTEALLLSLVAGLVFAFFTARPSKRIGPLDGALDSRERWAFCTFSFFISSCLYVLAFGLNDGMNLSTLVFLALGLTIVLMVLQAGYYLFLVKDSAAVQAWKDSKKSGEDRHE